MKFICVYQFINSEWILIFKTKINDENPSEEKISEAIDEFMSRFSSDKEIISVWNSCVGFSTHITNGPIKVEVN